MVEKGIGELITELTARCGLGTVMSPATPVPGGFMHKMYRVITDRGIYAVKHLNPEIMRKTGVHDNYRRAEMLERILEHEGIPIVPSITINGHKMQHIKGHFFYIFNWQEGYITDWKHISNAQCRIAGNLLGRIHAIDPPGNMPHDKAELSEINWREYVHKANERKNEIAPLLADNEPLLLYAEKELNKARTSLPEVIRISDGDMDPKNIMWHNGSPRLIDLECLDYGNPVSHALQLALQWSGIVTYTMDFSKMSAFFDGYLDAYDNHFRAYSTVSGLSYTWVEWLEYNIQRALGACADEAEMMLGISEVKTTIEKIAYIRNIEDELKDALDARGYIPA